MTAVSQSHHDYTFADYLTVERDSEMKHEFDAGDILARPGGTARHSALAANVTSALSSTRPQGCVVFESSLRVRISATGRATYPEASMICGPLEYDSEDAANTTGRGPGGVKPSFFLSERQCGDQLMCGTCMCRKINTLR